jgi:hypothetical protein
MGPNDCDGNPISLGDGVQYMLGNRYLRCFQVQEFYWEDDDWVLVGLTPSGERAILKGVQHCRVMADFPDVVIDPQD